jgi:hypothetical protein
MGILRVLWKSECVLKRRYRWGKEGIEKDTWCIKNLIFC